MKVTESSFSHLHYPFRRSSSVFSRSLVLLLINSGLACTGMGKTKCPCMQKLSLSFKCLLGTISRISNHGMANIGHVPRFGGSTSLQLQLYQGVIPKAFQNLKTGHCRFSFSRHRLFFRSFSLRPIGASIIPRSFGRLP